MEVPKGVLSYICYFIFFLPVFLFLFVLGIIKGAIFSPFVFLVIAFGDTGVVIGLWPLHLVWSIYCLIRTKKFGPYMKCLLSLLTPIPIALWTIVGVVGSAIMGIGYGYIWPVMETFRAISKEGIPIHMRLIKCFTDGTWSNVWGACTIVRDFADFSFHSYFSVMDELLESKGEDPIELKVLQLPGCILASILGIVVDVPLITLIVLYKAPILLFKGWHRLVQDLIGREGPFLETVCVPFAGLWILLWPIVVLFGIVAGILSSFGLGCYAAVVAYQESSTKRGLLYVVASVAVFDEYTNDLLYLREGSCFPRPTYRERDSTSSLLPISGLHEQLEVVNVDETFISAPSATTRMMTVSVILDSFTKACEDIGKELLKDGAIELADLDAWKHKKNKIVNIGVPAYAFLECFLSSIKNGSNGFIMRDNVEITSVNRPEGRIFDWFYEPMCIMKDQIRSLHLDESEELYFYKHCLYSGNTTKIKSWRNGGVPPQDEIRRAQLEGISRRLQGFCLNLSRLPTSRRRFYEVLKVIEQEAKNSRGAIFSPFVFLVIAFGDTGVVIGLWPLHLVWSIYCIIRTNRFGPYMKCLLILLSPIPIALWTIVGVVGSAIMGIGYGYIWPVMETFRAISKEGIPVHMRLIKCFTDGTWSNVWGACTIVRDFADFSFHSYFSVMDGLLESKEEDPIELKVTQIPGCILVAIFGILIDVPLITLIVLYKAPILLFKGWHRLIQDLIGREGPFLETVCIPFAGLWILFWPILVLLATLAGIFSSFLFGFYAAAVTYQESSMKKGLLCAVASASIVDEYTNDLLYLREGSCFPRPRYRERIGSSSSLLPVNGMVEQLEVINIDEPLIRAPSAKLQTLTAAVIWDSFIKACEDIGMELVKDGAIVLDDMDAWKQSKNKIVNIGIPAYAILECLLYSIKSGCNGFIMRDNVEITSVNRPEGRVFDWLYEPLCIMKDQIRSLHLDEAEELYFYKLCLYSGDTTKIESWQNGGVPPRDDIRRAQLEGISRRLQGFCLTLSRLPTSRRRFNEVLKVIEQEAKVFKSLGGNGGDIEAAA
ncbi:hypothetical protein LguiB_009145 [Lonicera macranthoides]